MVGILGIVVGLILYYLSRRTAAPAYQIHAVRLLGHGQKLPNEIVVTAFGRQVDKLAKFDVVFWNAGSITINRADLVPADPLRVEFADGAEILQAAVVSTTRSAIGAGANTDLGKPNSSVLTFEFLDARDGFVAEFLVAGNTIFPALRGTIKGVPQGPKHLRFRSVRARMAEPMKKWQFRLLYCSTV